MNFPLDAGTEGVIAGRPAQAELPDGAVLLPAGGADPASGAAVAIDTPSGIWGEQGHLAFLFKPSRIMRNSPGSDVRVQLVQSPLFQASVREFDRHLYLQVERPDGAAGDWVRDEIALSRLHVDWYHLLFTWDAASGVFDVYLNGVLQERFRGLLEQPWAVAPDLAGPIQLGGVFGAELRIAIRNVTLADQLVDEGAAAAHAAQHNLPPLSGEGRTVYGAPLDLTGFQKTLVYEADFSETVNVQQEDDLFDGDERIRRPEKAEWVLEGRGQVQAGDGRLHVENEGHIVLWNTREFPADFLLEFGFSREREEAGLAIVFFNTRARDGRDIFAPGLPRRRGSFPAYHSGALDGYHISYVSSGRRTANLRKNHGFVMPAVGNDLIHGAGPGPHRVRILKAGGRIALEVNGEVALDFIDDGTLYGPPWLHSGHIGLRQMANVHSAWYSHFNVWQIDSTPTLQKLFF